MSKNSLEFYVDFNDFPKELHKQISIMMQEIAFKNNIYWVNNFDNIRKDVLNIGYSEGEGLSHSWHGDGKNDEKVTLTEWINRIQAIGNSKKEDTLEKISDPSQWVGKQVIVWGKTPPGNRENWRITIMRSCKNESHNLYRVLSNHSTFVCGHIALLTGHEYRAFLPYDKWLTHDDEV